MQGDVIVPTHQIPLLILVLLLILFLIVAFLLILLLTHRPRFSLAYGKGLK